MLREFVIIHGAIAAAGEAFMHSKSRVNVGAISTQRNLRRIAEPLRVLNIQVLRQTPPVSLINMVFVAEVRRDLRSRLQEHIHTHFDRKSEAAHLDLHRAGDVQERSPRWVHIKSIDKITFKIDVK
jgi:hypothetical protein